MNKANAATEGSDIKWTEIEEEEKGRESSQYGEEDDSSQSQDNAAKQNANVMSEENSG